MSGSLQSVEKATLSGDFFDRLELPQKLREFFIFPLDKWVSIC